MEVVRLYNLFSFLICRNMNHTKITFQGVEAEKMEVLIAMLSGIGYEGFEELGECLLAYIPENDFDADELASVSSGLIVDFSITQVPEQNWNELWESNFEPGIVEDFCTVRAAFHQIPVTTPYEIIITPKMSFGTGHHATTQLVMKMMQGIDFKGKSVLDFGSGTGVLAILAEKLGASQVIAIDNDDWAVNNAIENVQVNGCTAVLVKKASVSDIEGDIFDVILANINRHILIENMLVMEQKLKVGGVLVMSGLLSGDGDIIASSASIASLIIDNQLDMNGWIALRAKHH